MGKKKSKQKKKKKQIGIRRKHRGRMQPCFIEKIDRSKYFVRPFRNMYFIPAFLAIPKFIIKQMPREIQAIPRIKRELLFNRSVLQTLASDLFFLVVCDSYAYMTWQYMKPGEYMEVYSGYYPAWILAHATLIWTNAMEEIGFLPSLKKWINEAAPDKEIQYFNLEEISWIMSTTVKYVLEVKHYDEILKVVDEHKCFEDFDFRESNQKTDFFRDWYHMRTKHPTVSLEDCLEDYRETHDGQDWDAIDESPSFESNVETKVLAEQFMAKLSEKDRRILELRLQEWTLEEIADELGYANHTGVLKRLKKIGQAFEKYADVDYDFAGHRII